RKYGVVHHSKFSPSMSEMGQILPSDLPGQNSNRATAPPPAADLLQRLRPTFAQVESKMGAVAWGLWPSPRFPSPLIGRVGDWRAGLGRSLFSLLPRPFGCEVSQHLDRATFPASATSNAAYGFPSLRSPVCFTSRVMGPILLGRLSAEAVEPCS